MRHWRDEFEIPDGVAYFNCAAVGPLMRSARKAGEAAHTLRAEPWRINVEHWYGAVAERRALFAELMGADVAGIALAPSTSYGLGVAAKNIAAKPGQRVLVLADEFPSSIYTWRSYAKRTGAEIVTVSRGDGESWADAVLRELDERVVIVSVPNVHWTDGALVDLAPIAERAHAFGAKLVLDISQSAGVMDIDFAAIRPDYLVSVGYKWLLGPLGAGYLYVAEAHRGGEPLEENWMPREGSEDFARLVDYQDRYRPGAQRFDVGQRSSFELTPIASAALKRLLAWKKSGDLIPAMRARTDAIAAAAAELGLSLTSPERGPHLLGVALGPGMAGKAAAIFGDANVFVGFRGDAIRIAPHLYNTREDIDQLIAALAAIKRAA